MSPGPRTSRGETKLLISSLTIDEVSFIALKVKLEERFGISVDQVSYMKKNPSVVKSLAPEVHNVIENILQLSEMIEVGAKDVERMTALMETYGLLPRDALHVAVMQRWGLTDIASNDSDFDRVSFLTRFAPERD